MGYVDGEVYYTFHAELTEEDFEKMKNVKIVIFDQIFNFPIDKIPDNIISIEFCYFSHFNHPVDSLPSKLESLTLGPCFNHPLDFLPSSLKMLKIQDGIFNYKIDNLPDNLEYLDLGINYRLPIKKFPTNLKTFKIPLSYNSTLKYIPRTLEKLYVPYQFRDAKSVGGKNFGEIKNYFKNNWEFY